MKTQFRKDLNREIQDKLLLKDSGLWQIARHIYRKFDTEIWATLFFISIAIDIWYKLGK